MATAVDARVAVPEDAAPSGRRLEAVATLLSLLGLLIQVIGYAWGWHGDESTAIGLWYIGFVGIVVPFTWLLLAPSRTGHQRLGAALAFGLIMYASWFLTDPILATRFDETLHVTTLVDMVDEHSFFYPNSTLPVSPHYPGLEFATAGVHWLTGLPLIVCQVLVVVTARSTFILALFLLASRIGRSTQVGAATVLLYAGSAQFYFFNSQFSYQTVAIAMLMAALYLLVRAFDSEQDRPWRLLIAVQVCLGGLAITHHLTSWLMLVLLWLLALFFWRGGEERRARLTLITAELATIVVLAWTAIIAPLLISYLGPIFDVASSQLLTALDGSGSREVGTDTAGTPTPTWELMVMAGSILLWMAMLVPAAWRAWRRGSLGPTKARYVPLAIAVVYPGLQVARFAPSAAEVADRASTFVTLAMALVVAAWLAPRIQTFAALVAPGLVLLILGGTLIGSGPDWQRVPGPYLAGAEQRSIDAESVAVAQWAGTYLPKDARVAADSTFTRLLPNFAPVVTITQPAGFDSMTPLFIAHSVDEEVLRLILHNDVDFIIVDTRLVGQTVRSGGFFEGSTGYGPDAQTIQRDQVQKFEGQRDFDLVLDGPVKVYDVRPLRHAEQTFVKRPAPGLPGSWTPWQALASAMLLLVGLLARGRLLDPRRFRARDVWRPAVTLPAAMILGAVGVLAGFNPLGGLIAASVLLYVLVQISARPAPIGVPRLSGWLWGVPIVLVAGACIALAVWGAWHGLLDHPVLPPPAVGGGA
ncbi:hypothetical protein [Nocardioides halotolerans]|uniref:hypothetical protein n=1 Tax=Nocardioides halotolerans TaxID=433660 RepID=UPI0003FB3538|nr:hypothetical protein [Nocardioides halotolerans]